MTVNKNTHAPFGTKTKRFDALGYHPSLETRPGTYNYSNLFPGCYEYWLKPRRITSKVTSWKKSVESEEYSKRLGHHCDHILNKIKWRNSINGPGWHEIPSVSEVKSMKFLRKERFPEPRPKAFAVPGPGTYGKNHVPHTRKEEKSKEKGFSFSTISTFQGALSRPSSADLQPPYSLPPNIYKIKSSIEELLSKRISKRGPYDLFTGPRFQRLVLPKKQDRKQIPPPRIDLNDWNHPKNLFKGKFTKCGKDSAVTSRIILKGRSIGPSDPWHPGPSDYDPYPPVVVRQQKFPFNSSISEVRPSYHNNLIPPPGRYNTYGTKRILGDGMKSAFLTKASRYMPQAPKWSWFEQVQK